MRGSIMSDPKIHLIELECTILCRWMHPTKAVAKKDQPSILLIALQEIRICWEWRKKLLLILIILQTIAWFRLKAEDRILPKAHSLESLDIRDEDYSLPLIENCDRRCSDAFITLGHEESIVTPRDMHKIRVKHHHLNFDKQLSR